MNSSICCVSYLASSTCTQIVKAEQEITLSQGEKYLSSDDIKLFLTEFLSVKDVQRFFFCLSCKKKIVFTEHSAFMKCTNNDCKALTKTARLHISGTCCVLFDNKGKEVWVTVSSEHLQKLSFKTLTNGEIMEAILLMSNFNLIYNAKTLEIHSIEVQDINLHDTLRYLWYLDKCH